MKTTIVYNHPYEKSYNHAILEASIAGAQKAVSQVQVIDLDAEKFNPVMTSEDLLGFVKHQQVDPQAQAYTKHIGESDHLILIFPIWWELMPAMMKGFIDKVIFPGAFYDYKPNGYSMQVRHEKLKTITIITTMNTPKFLYRLIYGNAIKNALVKGTFQKTGCKDVKWMSYNMVKMVDDRKRKSWLEQIEKRIYQRVQQ
ncbi:TPA: NAD(P)H-dependent oxidoreductase [Streptococcus suis]|nr:NAD(P)H-dependent oxidoreductase [Streptococcus suis]